MHMLERIHVLVLLFLALGLSCGEAPELLNLSDRVSNDFAQDSANSAAGYVRLSRRSPTPAQEFSPPDESIWHPLIHASLDIVPPSTKKLLPLFSIQRK